MAYKATFIGIDKHLDIGIRELTGAKRDATALWALFQDTVPNFNARLIVNEEATKDNVFSTLNSALLDSSPEDIVIISFSGHGSHDYRLVTYDTSLADLTGSSIPMDEISAAFKKSKAGIILFILDCCFSGQAPARVLEDSLIPRMQLDYQSAFSGQGRVFIAASGINEAALEHTSGHGLLTKAIIEILQSAADPVSLPGVMHEIVNLVRTEASRMGHVQNPVCLSYEAGGLVIPRLKKGECFYRAFPEMRGIRISNNIDDLAQLNLPQEILSEWKADFSGTLNDLQVESINDYRILDGQSLLVVAPTSSGKTFIGEIASVKSILDGKKAIFLLPYRSLVNEKYDRFSEMYGAKLGMRVIRCSGDYGDEVATFVRGRYDLCLFTYEMFLNIAVSNPVVLNQVGLVVLDEAQFITDPNRGISVELLLTHLLTIRNRGIEPQIIALSAVIGNVNEFDQWLGVKALISNRRPVPLVEGVLDRSGAFQYLDQAGKIIVEQLIPSGSIRMRNDKPSAQDVIVPLIQNLISKNPKEKVIIFRNMRGLTEGCANYLARDLNLSPAIDVEALLPQNDLSSSSQALRSALKGGAAFHNTNLNRQEKAIVERAFRDPNSKVRVLAATTTVAAGVNTPASTVILAEQEFIGEDGRPFSIAEYKNMAGRAGRLGFHEEGKSILLADNSHERQALFQKYVLAKPEQIESSFKPDQIETWFIRLLAQIPRVPKDEVIDLLTNTYGGYLANKKNPGWQNSMKQHLVMLLDRMLKLGLVEEELGNVKLTLLGKACGGSSLSFAGAMRLVELLRSSNAAELTPIFLMALVQALPEMDNTYTPLMKKGSKESVRPGEAAQKFGQSVVSTLQRFAQDYFDYYGRCKRVSILFDWVNGMQVEDIESNYSTTPYQGRVNYGDILRLADATRFHLRSAHQIACLMFVEKAAENESFENLFKQLEFGVPFDAVGLLTLPINFDRGQYLQLVRANISTVEDFWGAETELLKTVLGKSMAEQIEKVRPTKPNSEVAAILH